LNEITQVMKNFHLQILSVQSGQNTCQQALTTVQQPFQSLRHNLEEEERGDVIG